MNKILYGHSSSTGSVFSALATEPAPSRGRVPATPAVPKEVINAVYSHIRAVRALGRGSINTNEIAKALSLPSKDVERAVSTLGRKGVKVLGK
jgi:hypothetical protein